MKIMIIKDSTVTETEITVKCAAVDENLKRLLDELEHNNAMLTGRIDDKTFLISAEMIYYIESVDEKTLFILKIRCMKPITNSIRQNSFYRNPIL